LVLAAAHPRVPVAGPQIDRVPAFNRRAAAAAEDFDAFDRARTVASGLVRDARNRAVRVAQRDEHAIVGGLHAADFRGRLGIDADDWTRRDRAARIDRVARFADDAAATDFHVLRPGVGGQLAGRE